MDEQQMRSSTAFESTMRPCMLRLNIVMYGTFVRMSSAHSQAASAQLSIRSAYSATRTHS